MVEKILIVDDDADFIDAISTVLKSASFEVVSANGPMECFEKLVTEKPDLVILDIMMDNLFDGYAVCNKIKTSEEYKEFRDIPIIMDSVVKEMTGTRFSFDPEKMGFTGPDAYLDKPIQPELLLETIRDLLKKRADSSQDRQ